jgi:hypothetical protein
LVALLCLLNGCQAGRDLPKTVPAEGTVTIDDQPAKGATILFIGEDGKYNAYGQTDDNGKFKVNSFEEKSGAVPGKYKVEISKTVMSAGSEKEGETSVNLQYGLPKKYASFMTSGLSADLGEQGDTNLKFTLTSK